MIVFGNYQGIWLKTRKLITTPKITLHCFNDRFLQNRLHEREFDKVHPLQTPRSWVQTLVALKKIVFLCLAKFLLN
jgi:hypothetical protein